MTPKKKKNDGGREDQLDEPPTLEKSINTTVTNMLFRPTTIFKLLLVVLFYTLF